MPEVARRRHKRPRPQTSCRVCHQRKVRCNRELPCDQCIKHRCAQECQFDGIPARQPEAPNTPGWSSTGSVGRSSDDGSFFSDQLTNLGYVFGPDAGYEYLGHGDVPMSVKPNEGSRLPAHKWLGNGLTRGRTHYCWLLEEQFRVLKQHVDRAASDSGDDYSSSLLARRKHDMLRQRLYDFSEISMPTNVYEELPPVAVSCDLVFRYFETFDTIYPIIDRDEFGKTFNSMLAEPSSVSMSFAIQMLMIQALANATYPDDQAPIPRATVLRWLDLATSTPGSAAEIDEMDIEMVRLYALAVLARQVLKNNETRDDSFASACARAAMTLGLHRVKGDDEAAPPGKRNLHTLWEVIQDLEVQACLAAGMPPSTPIPTTSPARTSHETRQFLPRSSSNPYDLTDRPGTNMPSILSSSLAVRHRIVSTLNSEEDLYFEKVVQLSRELTRAMGPVSTLDNPPEAVKTFEYQYISFVYGRFLTALHRPFATLGDPAFYWSRTLCVRLSKQYVQELLSNFQQHDQSESFGTLLRGHGTMFRAEALHAIMVLCYELYRDEDDEMGMESVTQSEEDGKLIIKRMLEDFLPLGEKMTQTYELEGRSFVIPFMVLAHLDAVRHVPRNSEAYDQFLSRAAAAAVGQCFGFWSQLDLRRSELMR